MLNIEVLKKINFKSEEAFSDFFIDYFNDFGRVYQDPSYLNRKKYIEKFTSMYNICNSISKARHSEIIYEV